MLRARTKRQTKRVTIVPTIAITTPLTIAAVLAACAAGVLPFRSAFADALPAQAAPAGFKSVNNPAGGRILSGGLPDVSSTHDAFHAGLHKLNGYFGGTLEITSAVRSKDDQVTTAFFRATLHGTPVTGMSIIAFSPKGGSREAVLFDTSTGFVKTLPSLTERLKSIPLPAAPAHRNAAGGAGGGTTRVVIPTLYPHEAPDSTVGINIPADWKVAMLGDGRAVVLGPNKEGVVMNRIFTFITAGSRRARSAEQTAQFTHTRMVTAAPVAPFSSDVAEDYVSGMAAIAESTGQPDPQIHIDISKSTKPGWAVISGTRVDDGQKRRFMGTVAATALGVDSWTLTLWVVSSPSDEFMRIAPIMLAIEKTCSYDAGADRRVKAAETLQVTNAIKGAMATSTAEHNAYMDESQSRFESSMAAMRASQDSIDRSASGWIHVIRGTAVLEHTPTGGHGEFDVGFAQSMAQQDPENYRVVPVSEYQKGVDY